MTTAEFIIALFYRIDHPMCIVPKHPQAALYPSETVTLGVLYALKGGSKRAFYRWLRRDWLAFFPRRPEPTRLFCLWAAHTDWIDGFRAEPTTLGVVDSYGIELIHPVREGRSPQADRSKGAIQSPLDRRRQAVLDRQSMGTDRQLGLGHSQCARFGFSADDSPRRRPDDRIERSRLSCPSRAIRPTLKVCAPKTWGRTDGHGDGLFHVDTDESV